MAKRKLKKGAKNVFLIILLICFLILVIKIAIYFIDINKTYTPVFEHEKYYYAIDFGFKTIKSEYDYDNDGIDDYSDILLGAQKERDINPTYINKYYGEGYPPDDEGVCTDTIWRALKEAGYLLKDMIVYDIKQDQINGEGYYNVSVRDDNIDFRRVSNQEKFLKRYAESLTSNIYNIKEFMPGDIVTFNDSEHIAIISDKRNANGIPYLIQNSDEEQTEKEEDVLEITDMVVTGHYRFTYTEKIKNLIDSL